MNWDFEEQDSGLEEVVRGVDDSLELVCLLGSGSYADVFKVVRHGRVYALKVMKGDDGCDLEYFAEEYSVQKALAGIKGVPEIYELYPAAILMEYVCGVTLFEAGKQDDYFFEELNHLAFEIHEAGYSLPKDLHDENVLVDEDGRPWIIDFMQCCVLDGSDDAEILSRDLSSLESLDESFRM